MLGGLEALRRLREDALRLGHGLRRSGKAADRVVLIGHTPLLAHRRSFARPLALRRRWRCPIGYARRPRLMAHVVCHA